MSSRPSKPKILRVFPTKTRATPDDDFVRFGPPDMLDPPDCDEIHVSATFTWDKAKAEHLADLWGSVHSKVRLSGPAFDDRGNEFVPGRYLQTGHVITSRGCPRKCSHCYVPQREGQLRELAIKDGWIVHDNNLLACCRSHIEAVFRMLERQPRRYTLAGGLDARLLQPWHVDLMCRQKPERVYFAFDDTSMSEAIASAGRLLQSAGLTRSHHLYCYVLIGYPGDTFDAAETRCRFVWSAGFTPFAMLFRGNDGHTNPEWRRFQRLWCRPLLVRRQIEETQKTGNRNLSKINPVAFPRQRTSNP